MASSLQLMLTTSHVVPTGSTRQSMPQSGELYWLFVKFGTHFNDSFGNILQNNDWWLVCHDYLLKQMRKMCRLNVQKSRRFSPWCCSVKMSERKEVQQAHGPEDTARIREMTQVLMGNWVHGNLYRVKCILFNVLDERASTFQDTCKSWAVKRCLS